MNKKRMTFLVSAIFFALCLVVTNSVLGAKWTMKIGHLGSVEDEDHVSSLFVKNYVEGNSRGQIAVEVYPAAQLGNFRQQLESVALGTQEVTITTCGGAANLWPEIQVTDIPYIFPNDRVTEYVYDGWFTEKLREHCMKTYPTLRLIHVSNTGGWRCFVTKNKLIRTPKDLKGVKMRVIESDLQVNLVRGLGGNPTVVPWGELYTAFKTGVVEGTKNGITDVVNAKFHEMLKYITLDNHAYMAAFWWINDDFINSMPPEMQRIVLDAFYHLKGITRNRVLAQGLEAFEVWRKAGGKVYVPTPSEKAEFIKGAEIARKWYIDKYGRKWVDLLEKAVQDAEKKVQEDNAIVLKKF
ncbi:MAG: TRAP transporter substrate-binding protein DctP [Deltaproteobacteria bacterium]|nr:TRAP transporter substrate-binding protein DctP [Deltaproteobacteria bacterium]MBW1961445.1 TRAP transporter substrate-binding protein DctP [Deltaproteobacteria bacterium]MBW1994966.1 TRAP transporter substrate-binding protein DctP [Deltaproteobacteria bacterium]MBW2151613.1 TRAP transporter substrate-binding protein DctP [Deltaproteobacteria bacterium]